jgi:hypothetical protein
MSLTLSELKQIQHFCREGTSFGSYVDVNWENERDYGLDMVSGDSTRVKAHLDSKLVKWMEVNNLVSFEFDEHLNLIRGECTFDAEGILPDIDTRIQNLEYSAQEAHI